MIKQSKKELFKEIIRFLIVGGIATIGDYCIFYLFNLIIFRNINAIVNLVISTTLGFITGLLINWFLQSFVFKYLRKNIKKSQKVFFKFLILSLIGLGLTEVGMLLASPIYGQFVPTIVGISFDFWKLFMKCLMTGIVLILNYVGRKYIVFKGALQTSTESD